MTAIYILFFLITIVTTSSLHLNSYQVGLINKLIQTPNLKHQERNTINSLLYKSYEKLAIKTAIEFKIKHKYKCANIKTEELILSSKIGLFKAVKKYNGKSDFAEYSNIYMKSELLKLLTDTYALSSLPKRIRRESRIEDSQIDMQKYKHLLRVNLSIMYEPWQIDEIFVGKEEPIIDRIHKKYSISDAMNSHSPFRKRILYLKYFLHENRVLSNKHVAELMCCSEETVRKTLL